VDAGCALCCVLNALLMRLSSHLMLLLFFSCERFLVCVVVLRSAYVPSSSALVCVLVSAVPFLWGALSCSLSCVLVCVACLSAAVVFGLVVGGGWGVVQLAGAVADYKFTKK
jgi:hypothetical protein